jgi:hypothetical protein
MPSYVHETLIELFRYRPALAADLLSDLFGITLPAWRQASLNSGDLPELKPTERRADAVVTLTDGDDPVLAVVVEVQLRPNRTKRRRWPAYLATLYSRLGCPTALLVLCPDEATARQCAIPIEVGYPGWVLRPLVLGPERVPVVTDPEQASRGPELAVLSAIAHGAGPERDQVFEALVAALDAATDEHAILYLELVAEALPPAAREHLEEHMRTTASGYRVYHSEFLNKYVGQGRREGEAIGEARGEARGEVRALLKVLAKRRIAVPEDAYRRISTCADVEQLDVWVERAVTAESIDEVFG